MKQTLLFLSLLLGFAGGAMAQSSCPLTVTKSGTGLNRTYTCSSSATSPVYYIAVSHSNSPNITSTSSTGTLTENYTYGGFNYVRAYVTGANGCTDTVAFRDTVVGSMLCPTFIELLAYDSLPNNSNSFNVNYISYNPAPGYSPSTLLSYGDGTTGTTLGHTYASKPSNAQVIATVSYTHPTQPTCELKDTVYINPTTCMGLPHGISYVTPVNANYQFVNTASGAPGSSVTPSTRWYLKTPSGSNYNTVSWSNTLNHNFSNNGLHSLIAVTTWRDSVLSNSICTSRDTVAVNVTTVTNNLNVKVYVDSIASFTQLISPQVKTWLIKKDNLAGTLTAVDSTLSSVFTTWQPYYATANFYNIPSGTYLVKSHIINQPSGLTTGFLPTYIYNQAHWSNADTFVFTGVTNLSKSNQLLSGTPTTGPGFVGGLISAGANKGTAEGDPVEGITVFLRDAQGKVVQMATTGADGTFAFSNLAAGTYTVYPEELNFKTFASDAIHVTTAQNRMAVNFKRNETGKEYVPGSVLGLSTIEPLTFSVSPNPATDKLQINLGSTAGKVTATLSNTTGQVVLQEVISGSNTTLSVSQLPAGMYLLQLQNGKEIHTEKVQIQH